MLFGGRMKNCGTCKFWRYRPSYWQNACGCSKSPYIGIATLAGETCEYWSQKSLRNMNSPDTKLTTAFRRLRKLGYFAKQNWKCCQGCGCAAIPKDRSEKYVFYHSQDKEQLVEYGACYLSWDGDANEIVNVLELAGLIVEWEGTDNTRILVTDPDFKKDEK